VTFGGKWQGTFGTIWQGRLVRDSAAWRRRQLSTSHDPDDERFAGGLDDFLGDDREAVMSRTRWIWATRRQVRRKFPVVIRVIAATASLVVKSDVSPRPSSGQCLASTNACSCADSGL
jgi:hypothetical protein